MPLRTATAIEVDAFVDLLEDAAEWMRGRGIDQWRPGSLRVQRAAFVAAQARGELLVLEQSGTLIGGALLRSEPDPIWADLPAPDALYVSKLVVARNAVGGSVGARILEDLEAVARDRGAKWLRLDCVASNESLARYYQQRGYYPRGSVRNLLRHDKRLTPESGVAVGSLDDVDFTRWQPDRVATLLFVVRRGQVLLIHKQRGHGAGNVNGPGGMVEPGETPLQCALREIEEEVGVRALHVKPVVELRFQDTDGSHMLGFAFKALDCDGAPRRTDEAIPFWCPIERIPFDRMWQDDIVWLRYLIDGEPMTGEFLMHDDRLVAHRLRPTSAAELTRLTSRPHRA
jgi:8-oxo-dGTP diphosphatase